MNLLRAIHEQVIEERKKMDVRELPVGEYVMRRRQSDKEPEWTLCLINDTYLNLIREFPEDYRMPLPNEILGESS